MKDIFSLEAEIDTLKEKNARLEITKRFYESVLYGEDKESVEILTDALQKAYEKRLARAVLSEVPPSDT